MVDWAGGSPVEAIYSQSQSAGSIIGYLNRIMYKNSEPRREVSFYYDSLVSWSDIV